MKSVTLTKRQIERALERLFDYDYAVVPRTKMSGPVYDYAWTVWASRRDIEALQGKRAARHAKRRREIKP